METGPLRPAVRRGDWASPSSCQTWRLGLSVQLSDVETGPLRPAVRRGDWASPSSCQTWRLGLSVQLSDVETGPLRPAVRRGDWASPSSCQTWLRAFPSMAMSTAVTVLLVCCRVMEEEEGDDTPVSIIQSCIESSEIPAIPVLCRPVLF